MSKFYIISYDVQFLENGNQYIRLDFRYEGDDKKIKVNIIENVFQTMNHFVGGIVEVTQGPNYFVSTTVENAFNSKFNLDIKLEFLDNETNRVLEDFILPTSMLDIKKRSLGGDYYKPNIWFIGDSHVNRFFPMEFTSPLLQEKDYIINPISHPALSLNRFVKNNYLQFLSTFPIIKGDTILFMLGEIDCRVAFYRNSKLKNIPLESTISKVIDKYVTSLKNIQSKYPECHIKISLPNPPVMDGWITSPSNVELFLQETNQYERYYIRNMFEFLLKNKLQDTNIPVLDLTQFYKNNLGFTNTTYLKKDDHHFLPNEMFINNLKEQLNG